MHTLFRLPAVAILVCCTSCFAAPRLGSTLDEFASHFGAPAYREHLVRTSSVRWKRLQGRERVLSAVAAVSLEVSALDGTVSQIVVRCKRPLTDAETALLARRFLRRYRAADFAKPSGSEDYKVYRTRDGGFVTVGEHRGKSVVVLRDASQQRNQDIFDREAAKVRPPTSNH
jgi:hypothetical protein